MRRGYPKGRHLSLSFPSFSLRRLALREVIRVCWSPWGRMDLEAEATQLASFKARVRSNNIPFVQNSSKSTQVSADKRPSGHLPKSPVSSISHQSVADGQKRSTHLQQPSIGLNDTSPSTAPSPALGRQVPVVVWSAKAGMTLAPGPSRRHVPATVGPNHGASQPLSGWMLWRWRWTWGMNPLPERRGLEVRSSPPAASQLPN